MFRFCSVWLSLGSSCYPSTLQTRGEQTLESIVSLSEMSDYRLNLVTLLTSFSVGFSLVSPSESPSSRVSQTDFFLSRLVWVFYLIRREYSTFIVLRQDFLTSREHASLAMSKTVLVTGVPKEYLNKAAMSKFCEVLPGGAKRIWFAR